MDIYYCKNCRIEMTEAKTFCQLCSNDVNLELSERKVKGKEPEPIKYKQEYYSESEIIRAKKELAYIEYISIPTAKKHISYRDFINDNYKPEDLIPIQPTTFLELEKTSFTQLIAETIKKINDS